MTTPAHGFTRLGQAVHARTLDHHPTGTAYQRVNKRVALWITTNVGTMTCTWLFCLFALLSLPATLYAAHVIGALGAITAAGFILVVSWGAQSFIQLVLLPALMVGQNLQNDAADARASKTFEDVEKILDRLDTRTQGGLQEIMAAVQALRRPPRIDE